MLINCGKRFRSCDELLKSGAKGYDMIRLLDEDTFADHLILFRTNKAFDRDTGISNPDRLSLIFIF